MANNIEHNNVLNDKKMYCRTKKNQKCVKLIPQLNKGKIKYFDIKI